MAETRQLCDMERVCTQNLKSGTCNRLKVDSAEMEMVPGKQTKGLSSTCPQREGPNVRTGWGQPGELMLIQVILMSQFDHM